MPSLEMDGFEADDLIATFAQHAREDGHEVVIVSSDKDLMQLVDDGVTMLDPMKNRRIGPAEVREKFFVDPDKVIDIQALAGDSTDNVPGVPGIGIKTAAQLIDEYGDLDSLLARASEIKQPKRRQNLIENAELARISRQLVTLRRDVPVNEAFLDFTIGPPDLAKLTGFLEANEFRSLTTKVRNRFGTEGDVEAARAAEVAAPADARYELVQDVDSLKGWIAAAEKAGVVAVDTETTSLDAVAAVLVGISMATAPGRRCTRSMTPCCCPSCSTPGSMATGWTNSRGCIWTIRRSPTRKSPEPARRRSPSTVCRWTRRWTMRRRMRT